MRNFFINNELLVILIWVITGREDLAPTFLNYENNSMDMIWHNNERARFNVRKMDGNIFPPFSNNFPVIAQIHLFLNDFSKQTFTSLRHNRDIICAL